MLGVMKFKIVNITLMVTTQPLFVTPLAENHFTHHLQSHARDGCSPTKSTWLKQLKVNISLPG